MKGPMVSPLAWTFADKPTTTSTMGCGSWVEERGPDGRKHALGGWEARDVGATLPRPGRRGTGATPPCPLQWFSPPRQARVRPVGGRTGRQAGSCIGRAEALGALRHGERRHRDLAGQRVGKTCHLEQPSTTRASGVCTSPARSAGVRSPASKPTTSSASTRKFKRQGLSQVTVRQVKAELHRSRRLAHKWSGGTPTIRQLTPTCRHGVSMCVRPVLGRRRP